MKFAKTLGFRVLTWALVIWIGVSFIFFIPRMFPSDPVEAMIAQMTAKSGTMEAAQKEALRSALRKQFGLEGTLFEQYTYFLAHGLFQFDFGPSLMNYPTPVIDIIKLYLPYTLALSLTGTICMTLDGRFTSYVSRRYVKKIKEVLTRKRRDTE